MKVMGVDLGKKGSGLENMREEEEGGMKGEVEGMKLFEGWKKL